MYRSIWLSLGIVSLLWTCVGLMGCNRDECRDVDCGEFGTCSSPGEEAVCFCETGYEKDEAELCNVKSTTKYLGTWLVDETVTAVRDGAIETFGCSYQVDIQESGADIRRLTISNFPDLACFDTAPISCNLLVEGSAFTSRLSLRGVADGITYCDDQGADVNFSGFQISGLNQSDAGIDIFPDQDSMSLSYRLSYTLDADQDGTPENYRFDSQATFTRP